MTPEQWATVGVIAGGGATGILATFVKVIIPAWKANQNGNGHATGFQKDVTDVLQAITRTLDALTIRLEQLPTREDINGVAERNRHDYRNILATAQTAIQSDVRRAEDNISRLLERHP